MFACIYEPSLPKIESAIDHVKAGESLVNCAFSFSPLIEQTSIDTVVLNIEGQEHLFQSTGIAESNKDSEWSHKIADQIVRCAGRDGLKVNVAVASNPDAAIHAARALKGITVIAQGDELRRLGNLSLKLLDYSLAGIDQARAGEIRETFALWGLRKFGEFARLPIRGVAQRLGQEGVCLQKLARGISQRHLVLVQPPIGFEQSLELEHAITELEPLAFILSRLLNQLCANLDAHALATNELRLSLATEPAMGSCSTLEDQISTENGSDRVIHNRTLTLPVPMRNSKMFLRLCLLDLESHPPSAPVIAVSIAAEPTKPRALQNGLFIPQAPEPEKLELTLARLAKLVGEENVGSPELLNTYRPDAFRMKRFNLSAGHKKKSANPQSAISNPQSIVGFRRFRPPLPAQVVTVCERPIRISARKPASSDIVRGKILQASGPWRTSGDWWRPDVWARDEWDVAIADAPGHSEILCRIFCDLASEDWFVEGIYD